MSKNRYAYPGQRLKEALQDRITLPARVVPLDDGKPTEIKLSRQALRAMGRKSTAKSVNAEGETLSRRQRREAAGVIHKQNWDKRDLELVAKIRNGFTPEVTPRKSAAELETQLELTVSMFDKV